MKNKIKVFLGEPTKEDYKNKSFFIDLENNYFLRYHKYEGFKYMSNKTSFNKREILNSENCLFSDYNIKWIDVVLCDIVFFTNWILDTSYVLFLSKKEYQQLAKKNTWKKYCLNLTDSDKDLSYMNYVRHMKNNKRTWVSNSIRPYEEGVKRLVRDNT